MSESIVRVLIIAAIWILLFLAAVVWDLVQERLHPKPPPPPKPRIVHDLTEGNRYWGHNFNVLRFDQTGFKIAGWLYPRPMEGEFIRISFPSGPVELEILRIEVFSDPDDMFIAELNGRKA